MEIVEREFSRKLSLSDSSDVLTILPCYIHMKCDRSGSSLCLDWREICDGRIDCLNGGVDEAFCFEMEKNECTDDEYRCHNGLCIPKDFWEDGLGEAECLDRSDERPDVSYLRNCYQDPRFHCEEHTCRSNWHEFSCGDGQCVQKFDQCHSGRHILLIESMTKQGELSTQCWIAMSCLTGLVTQIEDVSCQDWLINDSITIEFLGTCKEIFQFPTVPVHFGHIRFLYEKPYLKFNQTSLISPEYLCYDERLCDCFIPTLIYENFTCIRNNEMIFQSIISGYPWIDVILELNAHFSSCLNQYPSIEYYEYENSTYSCENSSKSISKSRLIDENKDCCFGDDETYKFSCLLNDSYRISCPNENQCLSSLNTIEDCPNYEDTNEKQIAFHSFCDGFEEYFFEDFYGRTFTDESQCSSWPCNNLYSRCDGYWACSNGEDEYDCQDHPRCPFGTHPCISMTNSSFICLSSQRINDNIHDCLGGSDEPSYCRQLYPLKSDYERFHCQQSDLCLSALNLCDKVRLCPFGDDEIFCDKQRSVCESENLIDQVLCESSELKRPRTIYFSIQTSNDYPQMKSFVENQIILSIKQKQSFSKSQLSSPSFCNRGLTVRIWLGENLYQYSCLCPPSYYGDLCQYQNQRI
ncbi:unnamed protein product, partial [Adineta ricciae]